MANHNLPLHEIVSTACNIKQKKDKVDFLKKYNSKPLRNILKVMYDKNLKLNIPSEAPPYTPSQFPDSFGMLYREARKLKYFVVGYDGDNINQIQREALFIQMLEACDPLDAQLLIKVIAQKPLKGLTVKTLNEAFPGLIPTTDSAEDDTE